MFDDAHPLPEGAAKTPEDVAKLFGRALRHTEDTLAEVAWTPAAEGEDDFVRSPGFAVAGEAKRATDASSAHLRIIVKDIASGRPTHCRLAVVGSDGNYYLPAPDDLSPYTFNASWPAKNVWGNRPGKAPYRYLGRFFYSRGDSRVNVPPGKVRIEVAKGFEFQPVTTEHSIEKEPRQPLRST